MYTDEIERFQVEVLGLGGDGVTNDFMRQIIREAIEKWDEWKERAK